FASALVVIIATHSVMTALFLNSQNPVETAVVIGEAGLAERTQIQLVAWYLTLAAWPMGIGLGQFGALAPRIPELVDYGSILFVHNTILTFLVELGVLGFLLCLGLFLLI